MIAPFPHGYDVALKWDEGFSGTLTAAPRPSIVGGPPPEFGGGDSWWSPEHLLLSALSLCLMTTFLSLAERAKIKVQGYSCRARGVLEKTREGIVFTSFALDVSVKGAREDALRLQELVRTAKKYCIVSNSLKPPVTLTVQEDDGNR